MRKRLSDIPVGPGGTDPTDKDLSIHDYSHVLPKALKDKGYGLQIHHVKGDATDGLHASVTHQGNEVGSITGAFKIGRMNGIHGGHATIHNSLIDDAHQGKGLGLAMYEGFFAHAKNHLGATHASSEGVHSSMAQAVHGKMARKHGLDYQPVPNPEANPAYKGAHDAHNGPYSYALKSEVLAKSADQVLRMLSIPDERSLALKMGACSDEHLAVALQHEDLRDTILSHRSFGPISQHAILSNPSMEPLWRRLLGGSLSPDQLHVLHQTTLGHPSELDYTAEILKHPNCGAQTAGSLVDFGHAPALSHQAIEKWVLDMFVEWHISQPENPILAEMARAALKNPACSESSYGPALGLDCFDTQMAVLEAQFYLPKDPALTILRQKIFGQDVPLRLAVVSHPLADREILELAAQDKDLAVRTAARAKLVPILKEAGLMPEEITRKVMPEVRHPG